MKKATPAGKNREILDSKLWKTGAKHVKKPANPTLNFILKPPPLDLNLVEDRERIRGSLLESDGNLLALHTSLSLAFLPRTIKR